MALIGHASATKLITRKDVVDQQFEEEEAKAAADAAAAKSWKERFNTADGLIHEKDGTIKDPSTGRIVE